MMSSDVAVDAPKRLPLVQFHRVVMLGSGSSASTPSLRCLMSEKPCETCLDAQENPESKNNRHNPCLLMQFTHPGHCRAPEKETPKGHPDTSDATEGTEDPDVDRLSSVIIDCGKTFRQVAQRFFRRFGVRFIKSVLITHDHADASLGLDDLREFESSTDGAISVYADERTMASCRQQFGYLFPRQAPPVDGVVRWTASLQWELMTPLQLIHLPITDTSGRRTRAEQSEKGGASKETTEAYPATEEVAYLPFVPVPVLHGGNYYSNAFVFRLHNPNPSEENDKGNNTPSSTAKLSPDSSFEMFEAAAKEAEFLVYISDVSLLTEEAYIQFEQAKRMLLLHSGNPTPPEMSGAELGEIDGTKLLPTAILVVDMLHYLDARSTHFDVPRSIETTRRINATKTYYVGMSHILGDKEVQAIIEKEGLVGKAFGGYDGCVLDEREESL